MFCFMCVGWLEGGMTVNYSVDTHQVHQGWNWTSAAFVLKKQTFGGQFSVDVARVTLAQDKELLDCTISWQTLGHDGS